MADIWGTAGILLCIASLIWILDGRYALYTIRRFNKRCDRLLWELERGACNDGG